MDLLYFLQLYQPRQLQTYFLLCGVLVTFSIDTLYQFPYLNNTSIEFPFVTLEFYLYLYHLYHMNTTKILA